MSYRRLFFFSFFIIFILLFFHHQRWLQTPEKILRVSFNAIGGGVYETTHNIENFFARWLSYRNLFEENEKCFIKIASLAVRQGEAKKINEENKTLRAQLNFLKKRKSFVVAEVVGKTPETSANILIINKGLEEKIAVGQAVIADEGNLIGRIIKTENKISLVRLINDNQSKIPVAVLNQNRTLGLVSGEHNLRLKLTLIPLTESMQSGDSVITSNLEKGLEGGLVVGQIESVQKELYQPFQSAIIKPPSDLNKLTVVSVLLD